MRSKCCVLACLALQPQIAAASTIQLTLTVPTATTWQILASDSSDNAGICGVGLHITGITSLAFKGPTQSFTDNVTFDIQTYGFTNKLGPTGALNAATTYSFVISQGLADPPADYAYGVGQQAGSMASIPPPPDANGGGWTQGSTALANWGLPVVLFSGQRPANGTVIVDPSPDRLFGAVFKVAGQGAGENIDTDVFFGPLPEPAASSLVASAILCVLLFIVVETLRPSEAIASDRKHIDFAATKLLESRA